MRQERQEGLYKRYSDKWLIERFLRFGSVEEALTEDGLPIPFSYMTYRRKLAQAGVVKSPGRHTSLTEALHFFRMKALSPGTPLQELYRELPHSFKLSLETLHRVYNHIENNITRRKATALLISTGDAQEYLLGQEMMTNRYYGKLAGQLSVPMTFSAQNEEPRDSVLRVLQQEVFARETIEKRFAGSDFTDHLLKNLNGPFLNFDILDVSVSCYKLILPPEDYNFTSFKLQNHTFMSQPQIMSLDDGEVRIGVKELMHYSSAEVNESLEGLAPAHAVSLLNLSLQ